MELSSVDTMYLDGIRVHLSACERVSERPRNEYTQIRYEIYQARDNRSESRQLSHTHTRTPNRNGNHIDMLVFLRDETRVFAENFNDSNELDGN